jgi:hypothetical protein
MQELCKFMDTMNRLKIHIVMNYVVLKLKLIYTNLYNNVYFFRHKGTTKIYAFIEIMDCFGFKTG